MSITVHESPVALAYGQQSQILEIQDRILEIMHVYPKISPTMLQSALGPSLSPVFWRPALDDLISNGKIDQRAEFPAVGSRRSRPYSILELVKQDISRIKIPVAPSRAA